MTEPPTAPDLKATVETATKLLRAAEAHQTWGDRRRSDRVARLAHDAEARSVLLALTDEVLRIRDRGRAARRLAALVDHHGAPAGLGAPDRLALRAGASLAPVLPGVVMPLVERRVRQELSAIVRPADAGALRRHLARRRRDGMHANLNLLGEAILGETEAQRRVRRLVELLGRPDVTCLSAKITALCPNIDPLAFERDVARVATELGHLYRAAKRRSPPPLVYLDMEEYADLDLTVTAFQRALQDEAVAGLDAGIALQAYLPDTHQVLGELLEWARWRHQRHGGRTRIRLVKGANLAVEKVVAELRGWEPPTYPTKADADASFKRLLDDALDERFRDAVRIGVASHNLFDVAWALRRREQLQAHEQVELEMLEGMANGAARAVRAEAGALLVYTPIVDPTGFEDAVAYIFRRLDENLAPEHFLRASIEVRPDDLPTSPTWAEQAQRFCEAATAAAHVATEPRRRQDRANEVGRFEAEADFANEPDTDFTLSRNRRWLHSWLDGFAETLPAVVAARIGGEAVTEPAVDSASRRAGRAPYQLAQLDQTHVDRAVAAAGRAGPAWAATSATTRRETLERVAAGLAENRGRLLATMANDAGKPVRVADPEVSEAIDFARYYARCATDLAELTAEGIRFDPHGVVVVAAPWNFPLAIPAGGTLAALAAGNTVVLKPAPESVLTASVLAEVCWQAGVPEEALALLPCPDGDVGRHLITHPDVGAVILTGSYDTARAFLSWKPELALHAETSGKNALVITQAADRDAAVADLVHSAFGHAGQRCSAASLAIVEAPVYDDPSFQEKLRDAAASLPAGPATDPGTVVPPLVQEPTGPLWSALTTLEPGERWLVEPRRLDHHPWAWSPGVKLGVRPGSWFHTTECFGPVLGVMRAGDLDEAISWQNATGYGLTGGIHTLDPDEVRHWVERVEVGNAYVNRHITGSIVRRQPFGGWKRSSIGSGAKAGGPNYVASLGRFTHDGDPPALGAAVASYLHAFQAHFSLGHDPAGLAAERNVFRYRPLPGVVVRVEADAPTGALEAALAAAGVAGVTTTVSAGDRVPTGGVPRVVETAGELAGRLEHTGVVKVRVLGTPPPALVEAAHRAEIAVDTAPVVGLGRVELTRWVREQAVSVTNHRHGLARPVW